MDGNFVAVENRMTALRSELGTNIKALNYDINGLLDFRNNSGSYIYNSKGQLHKLFQSKKSKTILLLGLEMKSILMNSKIKSKIMFVRFIVQLILKFDPLGKYLIL